MGTHKPHCGKQQGRLVLKFSGPLQMTQQNSPGYLKKGKCVYIKTYKQVLIEVLVIMAKK
jgi:hypothetical protein